LPHDNEARPDPVAQEEPAQEEPAIAGPVQEEAQPALTFSVRIDYVE